MNKGYRIVIKIPGQQFKPVTSGAANTFKTRALAQKKLDHFMNRTYNVKNAPAWWKAVKAKVEVIK